MRLSHCRPSKIEVREASVLRSTSVSSTRRIMVPLLWRAYSQLKMKVRALPTWRNPVGEGAKRTRGLSCKGEFMDSDIKRGTFPGLPLAGLVFADEPSRVRADKNTVKLGRRKDLVCNPLI